MRRQLCFNSAARPWKQTDSSIFSVTNGSTIYHPRNHLVYVFSNETKYWNYLAWELVIYSSTSVAKPSRHSSDELFRKIFKENVPRRLFLRISKSSKTIFFFGCSLCLILSLTSNFTHWHTHTHIHIHQEVNVMKTPFWPGRFSNLLNFATLFQLFRMTRNVELDSCHIWRWFIISFSTSGDSQTVFFSELYVSIGRDRRKII